MPNSSPLFAFRLGGDLGCKGFRSLWGSMVRRRLVNLTGPRRRPREEHNAEFRRDPQRRTDRQHHRQVAATRRSDDCRDRDKVQVKIAFDHGLPLRAARRPSAGPAATGGAERRHRRQRQPPPGQRDATATNCRSMPTARSARSIRRRCPANLWNVSLVGMRQALDPKDGSVMPVSVVDRGNEQSSCRAATLTAHRYSIRTRSRRKSGTTSTSASESRAARQRRLDDQYDPVGNLNA